MSTDTFQKFVKQRKSDLERIARRTSGEHEFQDVEGEAFVMAADIGRRRGYDIDWSSEPDQKLVLAYVFQKLVHYEERNVRFAVRLDKSVEDEDGEFVHPLVRRLASDGGRDPLARLIEREDNEAWRARKRYCLATAWIRMLEHFDGRMLSVADHLLVSLSHAYRCHRKAVRLTSTQSPMPGKTMPASLMPGPWRTFRILRTPEQLTFDFQEQLSLLGGATAAG